MQKFLLLFLLILFFGCKKEQSTTIQLKFLDEFILSNNLMVGSTLVGGLSGIDFYNNEYYIACDDSRNPRYYKASIHIKEYEFDNIQIENVVELDVSDKHLDLESILVNNGKNLLTSEGNIRKGKDPSFFQLVLMVVIMMSLKFQNILKQKANKNLDIMVFLRV